MVTSAPSECGCARPACAREIVWAQRVVAVADAPELLGVAVLLEGDQVEAIALRHGVILQRRGVGRDP